ncbi:hypothetical protein HZH66_012768 [Vespula vulgaris]|uniref:Uncharacterized protein n=1 Tax=Vespula vulgaris TaxID=7454 RepID=A0A834MUF5_VESVU|nr:hypothetical protein HZH66_012768 [Vespula vulgaris]
MIRTCFRKSLSTRRDTRTRFERERNKYYEENTNELQSERERRNEHGLIYIESGPSSEPEKSPSERKSSKGKDDRDGNNEEKVLPRSK